jgi:hypothetical protein
VHCCRGDALCMGTTHFTLHPGRRFVPSWLSRLPSRRQPGYQDYMRLVPLRANCSWYAIKGECTPRKLATATQLQRNRNFPELLSVEVQHMLLNGSAQIEETALPLSNMCSTQADNNSRKLRLRCGCQFPWWGLALRVSLCA